MARAQRSSSFSRATSCATGAWRSSGCSSKRYSSWPANRDTDGPSVGSLTARLWRVRASPASHGVLAPRLLVGIALFPAQIRVGGLLVVVVVLLQQRSEPLRILVDVGPAARPRVLGGGHARVLPGRGAA